MDIKAVKVLVTVISLLFVSSLLGGCTGAKPTKDRDGATATGDRSIFVYCGAGLRKPVEEIGHLFESKTGIKVTYTFAGSAQLNGQILLTKKGDVYLPGDLAELEPIRKEGLVRSERNVVYHIPVLAVPKGNPANIRSLADMSRPGVKVALGDPKANPIGKLADAVLDKKGILGLVEKNVVVRTPTVSELLVYLKMKQADAAIVWEDNCVGLSGEIEIVEGPELKEFTKVVPVVVLGCSTHPSEAEQFAKFLCSNECTELWRKWGFKPYVAEK